MEAPNDINRPILKDCLTALPNELLQDIASHLGIHDLLKIRFIFKKSEEDRVLEILKIALKDTPLFVNPTTTSLRSFNDVCANPVFGRVIRHVVFIARALGGMQIRGDYLDEDLEPCWIKTFRDYKEIGYGEDNCRTKRSYQVYKRFLREHSIDYRSTAIDGETVLDDGVQDALVQGLSRLPLLNTVAISVRGSGGVGLNRSTMWDDQYWGLSSAEQEAAEETASAHQREINAARSTAMDYASIEQIGAMFLALNRIENKVTRLKLGVPSNVKPFDPTIEAQAGALDFLSNVEELTVALKNEYWHTTMDMWSHFIQASSQVRSLTIIIGTGPSVSCWQLKNERAGEIMGKLIWSDAFPMLQQLVLEAAPAMPAIVQADRLQAFLWDHKHTLRELRFRNVLPTHWNEGQDTPLEPDGAFSELTFTTKQEVDDLSSTIRRLLDSAAADLASLRSFELSISSLNTHDLHRYCWGVGRHYGLECIGTCNHYALAYGKQCPRSAFEDLAASMNVELKDGKWDFGEYVMAQGVGQHRSRFEEL